MKNLAVLAILVLILAPTSLFASTHNFVQINGVAGDSKDPAHPGWFDLLMLNWEPAPGQPVDAAQKQNNVCHMRSLTIAISLIGPAAATGTKMMQMCHANMPVPMMAIDEHGSHHMLQNASFRTCKTMSGDPYLYELFTVGFDRCTLHDIAPAVQLLNVPHFSNAQVVVGAAPTGQAFSLVSLRFAGTTGTLVLSNPGNVVTFFQQASQTRQPAASVTIKTASMTWTFTNLVVAGYQKAADGKETFNLSFARVDGPPAGL